MAYNKFVKILITIIIVISLLIIAFILLAKRGPNYSLNNEITITINGQKFITAIASTPQAHYLGLSGQKTLCGNCGLLFVFKDKSPRTFVMREMNFPLDIIFIDNDKIIKIFHNLEPEGSNPLNAYSSDAPVDKVLEINGGLADKYLFKVGDKILIEKK